MLAGMNSYYKGSVFGGSYAVCIISNLLNSTGVIYYFYLMCRGYGILPFIRKPEKFLLPIPFLVATIMLLTLIKVNTWNLLLMLSPL